VTTTTKIKENEEWHPVPPAFLLTLSKYEKNIDIALWLYRKFCISQQIPRIENV
jgi:hypothetical protein